MKTKEQTKMAETCHSDLANVSGNEDLSFKKNKKDKSEMEVCPLCKKNTLWWNRGFPKCSNPECCKWQTCH